MSDNQTLVYKKKKKKFKVFPIVNAILFIIIACAIMIPIYKVIITSIDAYSSYDLSGFLRSSLGVVTVLL